VIEDIRTGATLKLSRIGREHSFGKLEARFGSRKEFEQTLKATKSLGKYIPDKDIRQKFATYARGRFGSKALREQTRRTFRSALNSTWWIGKTTQGLKQLATLPTPISAPAKIGLGIARQASRQLDADRSQDRGGIGERSL
jgi:hypothetical protein